jgi:TIR domain
VKVFISWSGEKSKAVAQALNDWIPDVLQYVTPFMSDAGIDAGARPLDEIEQELGKAKFGIICVTSDNFESPWLNFEAGAISKTLDLEPTRVAPLLVDLETNDVNTPLKQFQMKALDKQGVYAVIRSINKMGLADGEHGLDEARLTTALDRCWTDLDNKIEAAKAISPQVPVTRTTDDKVDEVLESVRLLTNEVELIRRMTRTTWERVEPSNLPRTLGGLSGEGTMRASSSLTTGFNVNQGDDSGPLGLVADILTILEGGPYRLVGHRVNGGNVLTNISIQSDYEVPQKEALVTQARLKSKFPGVDIQIVTRSGE